MNFAQLEETFNGFTGLTAGEVDATGLARWFNEAQLDLAYDLGNNFSKEYLNVVAGQEYEPPAEALQFMANNGEYYLSTLGKIIFNQGGDHVVYYRGIPTNLTGEDNEQESNLHPALHTLLAMWAASRYWTMESEGDTEEMNLGTYWMNEYTYRKKNALSKLKVVTNNTQVNSWQIV